MKSFVALLALVAVAAADVSHLARGPEADAAIEQQEADVFPDQYRYIYKTSNGIAAQETGAIQNAGREDESIAVQGSNSYISPEGIKIETVYTADANGYQPQGTHLPTPPPPQPIPEYIQRAIAYIAANPPKPEPQNYRQ